MLGPADIEAWSDDLRDSLVERLTAAGWHDTPTPPGLSPRACRLHDRFRADRPLDLGELDDLAAALPNR